tara:strand:- start:907 stop:1098 length:192 start_codon:yes stop_codon:yes gene_type:complete
MSNKLARNWTVPCLRYRGDFIAMMFERVDALIVKVSPARVAELIESREGFEFNFTKKKLKSGS